MKKKKIVRLQLLFSFILAEDHRMSTETSHTTSKNKMAMALQDHGQNVSLWAHNGQVCTADQQ